MTWERCGIEYTYLRRVYCVQGRDYYVAPKKHPLHQAKGLRSIWYTSREHSTSGTQPRTIDDRGRQRSSCRAEHASIPPLPNVKRAKQRSLENIPDSAVRVLPTPGGPLKSIIMPLPAPSQQVLNEQECVLSLTFALDHVVKVILVLHLTLGERKNKLFMVVWKNQTLKSALVPLNILDGANQKCYL